MASGKKSLSVVKVAFFVFSKVCSRYSHTIRLSNLNLRKPLCFFFVHYSNFFPIGT